MWNTWGLRCVERSFIAAGYTSLAFKRGVEAGDINLEALSLKLIF